MGGIKLKSTAGGSTTLTTDPSLLTDEEVSITKAQWDAMVAGTATAWVRFDGVTGAIKDSFNVSTVVRNATGDYSITFSSPMDNANYSFSMNGVGILLSNASVISYNVKFGTVPLAGSINMQAHRDNGLGFDATDVSLTIHGGKA